MTYDQVWWPILRICALYLTHPKCTHTAVNTHPEQWAAILCCGAQGAVGGPVPCSRAPQSWYWERWTFTPPTYNSCRTWDSNSQPFDYESDSLTIRPRLPPIQVWKNMRVSKWWQNVHFWVNYSFNSLAIVKCRNFIQYTYGSFYRNVHFWHWQDVLTCNFF